MHAHIRTRAHTHTHTHTHRAFVPLWRVLKQVCEEVATLHANFVLQLTELSREIAEYNVAQRDKLKPQVDASIHLSIFCTSTSTFAFPDICFKYLIPVL